MSANVQIARFTLVGAANFVLTFIVFTAMLKIMSGGHLLSLAVAWGVGVVFSYVSSIIWVFKPTRGGTQFKDRFAKFFLASLLSLLLNMLALNYLVERTGFDPFYGQLILVPLIVAFNFSSAKYWSLRHRP